MTYKKKEKKVSIKNPKEDYNWIYLKSKTIPDLNFWKKNIFAWTAIIFDKTKSNVYLLDKYFIIVIFLLSVNLLTNQFSISYTPKNQRKIEKKTGSIITIWDSDIQNAI